MHQLRHRIENFINNNPCYIHRSMLAKGGYLRPPDLTFFRTHLPPALLLSTVLLIQSQSKGTCAPSTSYPATLRSLPRCLSGCTLPKAVRVVSRTSAGTTICVRYIGSLGRRGGGDRERGLGRHLEGSRVGGGGPGGSELRRRPSP